MVFGILKDIKEGEYRVICTPSEVKSIVASGHTVLAQKNCGKPAGFPDEKYIAAGAKIVDTMEEIYAQSDMVAKVKEFTDVEYPLIRETKLKIPSSPLRAIGWNFILKSVPFEAIPWSILATEFAAAVGPLTSRPAPGETPSAIGI